MKALVASQNRVKAASAEQALKTFLDMPVEVDLCDTQVKSGVSDQPMSLQDTTQGALNRLAHVRTTPGYDYYVAIEGGVYSITHNDGNEIWYEAACAAVADANPKSTPTVAYGPAYPVPRNLVHHLLAGKDLNEAMEAETGIQEIGKSIGFNGWLTEGKLDRQAGSAQAVLLALYGLRQEIKGAGK